MIRLAQLFRLKNRNRVRQAAKQWKFGMTSAEEQQWLRAYAAQTYRGAGVIVDLGCFLGATTIALAEGLTLNRQRKQKQIHAYDLFMWNAAFETWAKGKDVEGLFMTGGSFLAEFLRRTEKWRDYIVVHEQDLRQARWENGPIEVLFVDAMKSPELTSAIASNFFPHLVRGESYVAHQDFAHCFTPSIHFLTFRLRNCFSFVADLPQSSMFRLEKAIEPQMLKGNLSPAGVSPAEIEAAFDYSINLVDDSKKANVMAAKAIAYASRGEFARAYQIVTEAGYRCASRADELNRVKP